jgi:ATP-dependent Clp protease protease subunit
MNPLQHALFERRILLLHGSPTREQAGELAASLMTLDALGDDPIELRISAESDSLDVAFTLMDTIEVLGVDINVTVSASVGGTLVGVVAVCNRRRIGPMGTVHLREPREDFAGVAAALQRQASNLESRLERYARRLAQATGRPFEHIEADLHTGRYLDAETALAYGLVDEISSGPGTGRPRLNAL